MIRHIPSAGLDDPEQWRGIVRSLLSAQVSPDLVTWGHDNTPGLFDTAPAPLAPDDAIRLPRSFVRLAETVLMHRADERFDLLYRIAWRLRTGRLVMADSSDADMKDAHLLAKAVSRDIHKMRAFVRFRCIAGEEEPHYVSWFEPDHRIVRANAAFFVNRFAAMRWSILSPDLCIHWTGEQLMESDGLPQRPNLDEDRFEGLWTRYYSATFNPARLNMRAMIKEMPRRYWANMPETQVIPALIHQQS